MSSPDAAARSAQVEDQLRLARAFAAQRLPWFADALFRCRIVLTELVPVAAIDEHLNVYWNPVAVIRVLEADCAAHEELGFIWVHEISHVLRDHASRAKAIAADKTHWNLAADMEINDADWPELPAPTVLPPVVPSSAKLPNGRLAEWYLRRLTEPGSTASRLLEAYGITCDCGSGTDGRTRPWELTSRTTQQLTDIQLKSIRLQVAHAIRRHGTAPGSWLVWAQETLDPKVDWRKLLRRRLNRAIAVGSGAKVDYTRQRPNRRQYVYQPVLVPAFQGARTTRLAVVVDTSGSMSGKPFERVIGELFGILRAAGSDVQLVPCDAVAYPVVVLRSVVQLTNHFSLPGGGGTDMTAGITAALQLQPAPDTILVLTDGYTPYPEQRCAVPVIFGVIGSNAVPPDPPWGKDTVVLIDLA